MQIDSHLRQLVAQIAVFVILMSSVAPLLSHTIFPTQVATAEWIEVCTVRGQQRVAAAVFAAPPQALVAGAVVKPLAQQSLGLAQPALEPSPEPALEPSPEPSFGPLLDPSVEPLPESVPAQQVLAWEHCPYCSPQALQLGLRSSATQLLFAPTLLTGLPPHFFFVPRTPNEWATAQARAPPRWS